MFDLRQTVIAAIAIVLFYKLYRWSTLKYFVEQFTGINDDIICDKSAIYDRRKTASCFGGKMKYPNMKMGDCGHWVRPHDIWEIKKDSE